MTSDWRKIEAAIADFLEREGLEVSSIGGDHLAFFEDAEVANITALARELADLQ